MDFAFSDEQQMLRDQARSFISDKLPAESVAEIADGDDPAWDTSTWKEMAELGWIGLSAPEEAGGSGMSFIEEAVLFEELGYGLYPGPYFSTVGLALPALTEDRERLERVIAGESVVTFAGAEPDALSLTSEDVATRAQGSGDDWTLSGRKILIPDAALADTLVVSATADGGVGLWAVESDAVSIAPAQTMDTTRRLGSVELAETPAKVLVEPGRGPEVLSRIRTRALAALALEAVGVGQKALDLAKEHVSERKQFDRPIGAYQAVSHQVANTYVDVELARSLAYWAAWSVAEEEEAPLAASSAKWFAAEAAVAACERCIQVHGGIGFTWEHPMHRYYKRSQWIESFEGYGARHRADVAAALTV